MFQILILFHLIPKFTKRWHPLLPFFLSLSLLLSYSLLGLTHFPDCCPGFFILKQVYLQVSTRCICPLSLIFAFMLLGTVHTGYSLALLYYKMLVNRLFINYDTPSGPSQAACFNRGTPFFTGKWRVNSLMTKLRLNTKHACGWIKNLPSMTVAYFWAGSIQVADSVLIEITYTFSLDFPNVVLTLVISW